MSEDNSDREEDCEIPHNLAIQLKRKITVRGNMYIPLSKVEEGFSKIMRFELFTVCPMCGGCNHVKPIDLSAPGNECEVCGGSKIFTEKSVSFTVYAPTGTRHGSSILIQDEGSYGPQGIRGDIIVTFKDKPHEHFLRVFDDVIVCFQINREESAKGAVRLLNLISPLNRSAVLKTEEGESISDNEFRYVNGLGLPNCFDKQKRGRLIIVFIVKDKRSMFPVKLKDIEMYFKNRNGNISNDEQLSDGISRRTLMNEVKEGGSTAPLTNGLKRSRAPNIQNLRKRKKATLIESRAYTSSESLSAESDTSITSSKERVSSPLNPPSVETIPERVEVRGSRIMQPPIERLTASEVEMKDPLNPKRMSFLDRLVYAQTIPLPYRALVKDAIPMSSLTVLWERKYDPRWWHRVEWAQSLPKDPDTLLEELSALRSPTHSDLISCVVDTPLFDVREVELDEKAEALKVTTTMQSQINTEFLQFTPQKLSNVEKIQLLKRMRKYLRKRSVMSKRNKFKPTVTVT